MTKKFHERDKGQMGKKIDRKKNQPKIWQTVLAALQKKDGERNSYKANYRNGEEY